MKNMLYTDADFTAVLLVNEEQKGNTISVVVDADSTATQSVVITAGSASQTVTLTASSSNTIKLQPALWNYGDVTTLTLNKGGSPAGTITITFPDKIETDASLYETSTGNYTMQGSNSIEEQIVQLQEELASISTQVIDYILPTSLSQSDIADGNNNTVLEFEFYSNEQDEKSSFYSLVQYTIATTVSNDVYDDCTLTITYILDGATVATIYDTSGDCRNALMLNFMLQNLSKGNHTFAVNFALSGGSMSGVQFVSAYMLAAVAVESGEYEEEYDIYEDLEFAEYMEEGGSDLVGEYIELETPTGGTSDGSFSGDQFCDDWLSAFVRPIEYLEIYNTIAGYSYTYPSTEDDSGWSGFIAHDSSNKLIPIRVDELVQAGTSGKHVNMWFAEFLLQPWHGQSLGLKGVYIPSTVAFKCKGNYPVQGYGVFDYGSTQPQIFRPSITGSQAGCFYATYENQWTGGIGSNMQSGNFILVYNVDAFKTYISNLTRDQFRDLLDGRMLALAACHIEKNKVATGTTDWSDNDDYHGE